MHAQGQVGGRLPTKNKPGPLHVPLCHVAFSHHLLHKVRREVNSAILLLRGVKNVIVELSPDIKVTGFHSQLETPDVGGGGWKKEGGRKDERIETILGKVPNNSDIVCTLLNRKPRDNSSDLTWDNVASRNKLT
jgi:hypothetical protein